MFLEAGRVSFWDWGVDVLGTGAFGGKIDGPRPGRCDLSRGCIGPTEGFPGASWPDEGEVTVRAFG